MDTILIVDDDKDLRFNLSHILQDGGYKTTEVERGEQALLEIKERSPDIVLLDINLPDITGMEVLKRITKISPSFIGSVIIITAYGDIKGAIDAMKLGAFDYLTKPFNNEELILTIEKALKVKQLSKEVETLKEKLGDKINSEKVMGTSSKINSVLKKIDLVAPTNMSVIIQGASGTGKEVISKLIYQKSSRKDKPFIPIDCGAIPENLIESELFGFEKGAFTGADKAKKGKIELAKKGTLFLDEITNLSGSAQAKFLRALEEREIHHLGGEKPIKVDIRIIAASNVDILDAIKQKEFREDLYHRLNEFKITLPLLQERKDDIPILAKLFLENSNRELNKKITGFSTAAMKKLLNYSWPGNVRELRNLIKKAVLLEDKKQITSEVLEFEEKEQKNNSKKSSINDHVNKILEQEYTLKDIMFGLNIDIEREIIKKVLEKINYNKSKAAKILNIERKTLYEKLKKLGIEA